MFESIVWSTKKMEIMQPKYVKQEVQAEGMEMANRYMQAGLQPMPAMTEGGAGAWEHDMRYPMMQQVYGQSPASVRSSAGDRRYASPEGLRDGQLDDGNYGGGARLVSEGGGGYGSRTPVFSSAGETFPFTAAF
jgi:hypothetical protein